MYQQQNNISALVNRINALKNAIDNIGNITTQEKNDMYVALVQQHNDLVDQYRALSQNQGNQNQYVYNNQVQHNNQQQVQYRQQVFQPQITPIQQQEPIYSNRYVSRTKQQEQVTIPEVKTQVEQQTQSGQKKLYIEGHEFPLLCSNDREEKETRLSIGYKREVELKGDRPIEYNDYVIDVDTIELDNIHNLYKETTEEKVYNILYTEELYSPKSMNKIDIEDIETMSLFLHKLHTDYPMFSDYINTRILPIFNILMDGKYKLCLTSTNLPEDIRAIITECNKIRNVEKKENATSVFNTIVSILGNLKIEDNVITSKDYILGIIDSELHSILKSLKKDMYGITKHSYPTLFKLLDRVFQDDSITYKTIVVYGETKAIETLVIKDIFNKYVINIL